MFKVPISDVPVICTLSVHSNFVYHEHFISTFLFLYHSNQQRYLIFLLLRSTFEKLHYESFGKMFCHFYKFFPLHSNKLMGNASATEK